VIRQREMKSTDWWYDNGEWSAEGTRELYQQTCGKVQVHDVSRLVVKERVTVSRLMVVRQWEMMSATNSEAQRNDISRLMVRHKGMISADWWWGTKEWHQQTSG
jgi:hypothetical protein